MPDIGDIVMEKQIFTFGKPAEGDTFTDRKEETARLSANFKGGINTFLLSPRRWGKTSLVQKVMNETVSPTLKVVFVDVFKCRTPLEFSETVASAVLSQTSTRIEEFIENAKKFLGRINLGFNISSDPTNSMELKLGLTRDKDDIRDALELVGKIAESKGIRIVVCIDEFQQIAEFEDSLSFQKELRTIWQHQPSVSYCLFGSKKHMMEGLFDDESKPFYKFGDVIYLKRIPLKYWNEFIINKFKDSDKTISEDLVKRICETVEYHSSYVQQLSWYVFIYSSETVEPQVVDMAIDELISQNTPLFESRTESLPSYQMNFLRAVASGIHKGFSSAEVIGRFRLGSSANVAAVRKALLDKNLIYIEDGMTYLADPVLGLWLLR